MPTKISWCSDTINPVVGCSKLSAGCQNCYAASMARRLAAMHKPQYEEVILQRHEPTTDTVKLGGWNGQTAFVPSELEKPYKWKKPKTIFISSMGDLFHESVDTRWIDKVMHAVHHNPKHSFIFLTKRPVIMKLYFDRYVELYGSVAANLILGVSVEDQATANKRIPVLLNTPAARRFVSIEPMIGLVNLERLHVGGSRGLHFYHNALNGDEWQESDVFGGGPSLYPEDHPEWVRLDGVVLGGESGPKARPLDPEWVRLARDQCEAAGVPFMFKQASGRNSDHWRQYCDGHSLLSDGFPVLDGRIHRALAWEAKHAA